MKFVCLRLWAVWACLLCGGPQLLAGENRLWLAEVELVGPLQFADLEVLGAGRTHIAARLLAGETRALLVPVPARAAGFEAGAPPRPQLSSDQGELRFLRWSAQQPQKRWDGLPRGLRARPRPNLAAPGAALDPAALLLLAAGAIGSVALRRRRLLLLLSGSLALAALLFLPLVAWEAGPALAVLEGDAASPTWVLVRGQAGSLPLALEADSWLGLEVEPAGLPLVFEVRLEGAQPAQLLARAADLPRASLFQTCATPALRPFERELGGTWPLAQTWIRAPGSGWQAHGAWPAAVALPAPLVGAAPAPGWLAAGLPQGPEVLLGEFAGSGPFAARYLRLVGAGFAQGR